MQAYRWLAIAAAAALTACSGTNGASTLVPQTTLGAGAARGTAGTAPGETGVWGQVVHAVPSVLVLTTCGASGSFDAIENFHGDVTAVPEDPQLVSVDPPAQVNEVYPTLGGLKHAVFTVHALGPAGSTRIVVTDKKGNVDYVSVTVVSCVIAPPPVCSSSSARRVDGKRRVNSGSIGFC